MAYENIDAMNWSSLKNMATSPRMFQWRREHSQCDSQSFLLGRAVHCMVLEPEVFDDRYVILGKGKRRSSKESRDQLTAAQGETLDAVVESIRSNRDAMDLIEETHHEVVIEWEVMGVPCKARMDGVAPHVWFDLKTTRELSRFERSFVDYLYHGQFGFYGDGAVIAGKCNEGALAHVIVAETNEPYDCAVLRVPDAVLEMGRELYQDLLGLWKQCERTGIWPGREPSIRDLELPRWAWGSQEDEL